MVDFIRQRYNDNKTKYSVFLPREFTRTFLGFVYILGFIITPYWILPKSVTNVLMYFVLTITIGLIWVLLSAGALQIEFNWLDILLFIIILIEVIALNYFTLNSVIPYKGDEVFHIERTLEVVGRIRTPEVLVTTILFFTLLVLSLKKRWIIIWGLVLLVVCTLYYFTHTNPFTDLLEYPLFFLRYPFINYWLFTLIPKSVSLIGSPYHEVLYRIIPAISMSGVIWVCQKRLDESNFTRNILWGIAFATIPLVFYYSSILYLEPPAVFLMTIACLDANNLLQKNSQEILQMPSWYALILIGFIKETAISFLVCFMSIRLLTQLWAWNKQNVDKRAVKHFIRLCAKELGVIFSVLAPISLYLYFRTTLTSTRSFTLQFANLADPENYGTLIISMIEQFGLFFLFLVCGCILLIRNKEYMVLVCQLSLIVSVCLFHALDKREFIGYSRFNLFILPPILALSLKFLVWAGGQRSYIGRTLLVLTLVSNLLLSPIYPDGTKIPYWGNHLIDTSEHYYPYQDALIWIKNNYPEKRMLFTGLDFYYPFQFYWRKLNWQPLRNGMSSENIDDKTLEITRILKKAESGRFDVVVYRVKNRNIQLPRDLDGFRVKLIENSAHSLIIFYKP